MAIPIHRRDQRAPHSAGPLRLVPQCANHDRTPSFRDAFRRTDAVGVESRPDRRLRLGSLLALARTRSEEHTSELQSLMRISYAVFCLKKNNNIEIIVDHHLLFHHTHKSAKLNVIYTNHNSAI